MIRNVILDWSGTLVDDLPAVWEATNHVLRQAGHPGFTLEEFRAEKLLPVREFYARVLPGRDGRDLERWFLERFATLQDHVVALPHAREFLRFLRRHGLRTFICTSVPDFFYQPQLQSMGWRDLIEASWSGVLDKREAIHELLGRHGLVPGETLFVGDLTHDLDAARAGGVAGCAVLTGYQRLELLRTADPHLVVEHLGELQRRLEAQGFELFAAPGGTRRPVPTVGALIFNHRAEVLLVQTRKWSNLWGIPGGKMHYGETAEAALRREILEETGLVLDEVRFVMVQDCVESPEFYRPEHFLLLNYVGRCNGAGAVRLNEEAQAFAWLPLNAALERPLNRPTRILLERVRDAGLDWAREAPQSGLGS